MVLNTSKPNTKEISAMVGSRVKARWCGVMAPILRDFGSTMNDKRADW